MLMRAVRIIGYLWKHIMAGWFLGSLTYFVFNLHCESLGYSALFVFFRTRK